MHPNIPHSSPSTPPDQTTLGQARTSSKPPRVVLQENTPSSASQIFAFPPNRDTLGGTAYLIVEEVNILVDCPSWDETNYQFLLEQGGIHWLCLTHRGGIGKVHEIQQAFGCEILVQEQEAYLLPGLPITPFGQNFDLTPHSRAIWTPGYSPGSACVYHHGFGGVLFSGRHLLPNPQGHLTPLKTSKTFHWHRQLQSVRRLLEIFSPETLHYICPGANLGFLRGKYSVEQAYQGLEEWAVEGSRE